MHFLSRSGVIRLLAATLAVICLDSCGLFGGRDREKKRKKPIIESLGDYQLAGGNVIFVEVFEEGQSVLAVDLAVNSDGNILVPKIGAISVDGMAPLAAAKKIEFLARSAGQNHLSGPRVHIKALDRRPVVHVSGHVIQSGPVTFYPGLTVSEAVGAAGGVTGDANSGAVSLTSAGRKSIVTSLDTRELQEGDVVNIPRRL